MIEYPNFQHHPDGWIYVRKTKNEMYVDTIASFEIDYGSPYPGFDDKYIGRYYEPGINHYFHTEDIGFPQDLSWEQGDAYIAAYDSLLAAKVAREAIVEEDTTEDDVGSEEAITGGD